MDLGFEKPVVHQSRCPTCAQEAAAEREAKAAADKARERARKVTDLTNRSAIPARFSDCAFSNYAASVPGQKIALSVCRKFAEAWQDKASSGGSLVLTGSPGTGKTHLACAIGNQVIEDHLASVLFTTVSGMLRAIKQTYRKDSERSESDILDRLLGVDLLILDEVGIQVGSEHEKLLMFEVLNGRYQDLQPTVLISNLDVGQLEEFLGHRVMDRYRECGAVLAFDWESHRGKAA